MLLFVLQAGIDVEERVRGLRGGEPFAGEREIALLGVILALVGIVILLACADKRARRRRDRARRRARSRATSPDIPQTVTAKSDSFVTFSRGSTRKPTEQWEFRNLQDEEPLWLLGPRPGDVVLACSSGASTNGSLQVVLQQKSDVPVHAWLASVRRGGRVKLFPVTVTKMPEPMRCVVHPVENERPQALSSRARIETPLRTIVFAPNARGLDLEAVATTETTELGLRRAVITHDQPFPERKNLTLRCRLPGDGTPLSFPVRTWRPFEGGHELILEELPAREQVRFARAVIAESAARHRAAPVDG